MRGRSGALSAAAGVAVLVLVLAACAAGPNDAVASGGAHAAGFWLGLWHGLIAPISFLVSLFRDSVSVYEVRNAGNWYDFGFILGVATVFSGPASARRGCGGQTRKA